MSELLRDLDSVVCLMDDLLVHGKTLSKNERASGESFTDHAESRNDIEQRQVSIFKKEYYVSWPVN